MTQLRAERILKVANENYVNIDEAILDLIKATEKSVTDSSRDGLCKLYFEIRDKYASLRSRWMQAVLRREWLMSVAYFGIRYTRIETLQLIPSETFKKLCEYDNFFFGHRQITNCLDGLADDFFGLTHCLAFSPFEEEKEEYNKLVANYRRLLWIPDYVKINLFGLQ